VRRRSHSQAKVILPTNAELLILDVLWELGEGTVQDVVNRLPSPPAPNYKTVQSLLRIMENRGLAEHKTRGRAFVFIARVNREEVRRASTKRLLDRNFQGSCAAMLMNLLDSNHVKEEELDELEALIQRYRDKNTKGESIK
jgi:BlaI family transcriptional regulator, penicillinase repressor